MKLEQCPQTTAFIEWAYSLFGQKPTPDDLRRSIHVAAYDGCYGLAGWVITVNGSPTKGTIIIEPTAGFMAAFRFGRIVRGQKCAMGIQKDRYESAVKWVKKLMPGIKEPMQGF